MSALETQASQLSLQASQECERLVKDRTLTLQMLQKVPQVMFYCKTQLQMSAVWTFAQQQMYTFLSAPGEGEAVGPGEEIPQPDGGQKLPQVLHCYARGERASKTPAHSCTLGAPGLATFNRQCGDGADNLGSKGSTHLL